MIIARSLAAVAACLAASTADAFVIDLTGRQTDGAALAIAGVINENGGAVLSIDFDFTYSTDPFAANDAWGSELIIQLGHPASNAFVQLGTVDALGGCSGFDLVCDFDLDLPDAGGTFSASGSVDFDNFTQTSLRELIGNGAGEWELVLATFFDGGPGPEGEFLSGTLTVNQVPLPAAAVLLAPALAGLMLVRRRRAAVSARS